MTLFSRYIGIDYSGAKTPTESLKGLRVYMASGVDTAAEVPPPPSPRKYWTRRGLAEWLVAALRETQPTIVGIDHAFSFPQAYFDRYDLPHDWQTFLDDFCAYWPTDDDHMYVDFIRDGLHGNGAARTGNTRWRRLTDLRSRTAKSPFHFDVQGAVAKSTHSGLPWLRHIKRELAERVHMWPFEGWNPPAGTHVVTEVYPSLWRGRYPPENRTGDQHDAYTACRWLQDMDTGDELHRYLSPSLSDQERSVADFEGWILGIA